MLCDVRVMHTYAIRCACYAYMLQGASMGFENDKIASVVQQ